VTNAARRVIVVAGMHRAGTSVVARGLMTLGVDLGDALMSADLKMNARGFFEDMDIVARNDALLDGQGADWKSLALLDGVDWDAAAHAGARSAAQHLLEGKLARTGQYGFKDPRVPRLLPFWQRVLADMQVADAYVIAVRHPQAVIDSLTARDGLDMRRSGWLWLTHLACALRYTQGRPRVIVDYDRVLAEPAHELARMASALQLPAPAADAARRYAEEFLSAGLRHAAYAPAELAAAGMLPLVADAHALAQRLACDEVPQDDPATVVAIDALFDRVAALSPLLGYAGTVERAADGVPRLEGELAWAQTALSEASAYNEELLAAVRRKEDEMREAQAYNSALKAALAAKESDLLGKEGELIAAHARLRRIGERVVGRMLLRYIERNGQ
jgi:hypothetical protein